MSDAMLSPQKLPPVCMSLPQLKATLLPLTAGYKWGEETIRDLWILGAPMPPQSGTAGIEDVRLIMPSKLMEWLEDVLKRQGRPLDTSAVLYAKMIKEGN